MRVGYYLSTPKKGRRTAINPHIPTLYVLIGVSGSGKSTFCNNIPAHTIVSTDKIRYEYFGDEADQREPRRVFEEAYIRAAAHIRAGFDAYFDATNTTAKARKNLLKEIYARANGDFRKVAILFMTPLEECKRRNAQRQRVVPEDVIDRQYVQLMRDAHTIPDQFDEVVVI